LSGSQTAVSSSSRISQAKASGLPTNSLPKWRGKLYEHWVELVAGGLVVLFLGLWLTELREHESTKAQLARAEDGRQQPEKEVTELRKKIYDLGQQYPILQLYGPRAKYTATYDPPKEVGAEIVIGKCPIYPCLRVKWLEIEQHADGQEKAFLGVNGHFGRPRTHRRAAGAS
jgi:hypothetical protein